MTKQEAIIAKLEEIRAVSKELINEIFISTNESYGAYKQGMNINRLRKYLIHLESELSLLKEK